MDSIIFDKGGSISVLSISKKYRAERDDLSDAEFYTHIMDKDVPPAHRASAVRVNPVVLPNDRTFRNAWKKQGNSIQIDMPEARIIHQVKIERIKNREMKLIADQIIIEQALGNDIAALQVQVQGIQTAIDNVGPNINAAGTPAMLKAVWPVGLPTE